MKKSNNIIPETIENICFPRSGHRFHRNILEEYFCEGLKFHEFHTKTGCPENEANYVKNHDLGLMHEGLDDVIYSTGNKYVIQIRHPLESVVSYFEFLVKQKNLEDDVESWNNFFPEAIQYWKLFIEKWCVGLVDSQNVYLLIYENLRSNPLAEMTKLIKYLTGLNNIDSEKLRNAVNCFDGNIIRYREEESKNKHVPIRDITLFKYYDEKEFVKIENSLYSTYLEPFGFSKILSEPFQNVCTINSIRDESFKILIPKSKYIKKSFFTFSHPKAGSTLLDNLLSTCCECANIPTVNLPSEGFKNGIDQRFLSNSIDKVLYQNGYGYLGWRLFPYETSFDFTKVKSVYLVRDVRDMLVSLYFSRANSHVIPEKGLIRDKLLQQRSKASSSDINKWVMDLNNYRFYLTEFSRYLNLLEDYKFRVYRYEDVIFQKEKWLQDMCLFLNIELNSQQIRSIARKYDIRPDKEDPAAHIRSVTPGNYKKHLSKEAVDYINDEFNHVLSFFHYDKVIDDSALINFM